MASITVPCLCEPSDEQQLILDHVANNQTHLIVDAVAGSGKTTTVLLIAKHFPLSNVVQVTYNTKLKDEVREKAANQHLANLVVHTFHSIAMCLYGGACQTDDGIISLLRTDAPLKSVKQSGFVLKTDIFIIDEVQDSTALYYALVRKILVDIGSSHPMCIFTGDRMQGVYKFKGADSRFLTMADRLYPKSSPENANTTIAQTDKSDVTGFSRLSLSTTFRLTEHAAWFVNNVMLGEPRIQSCKPGPPVVYLHMNAFNEAGQYLCSELLRLMAIGTLKPSDIMVIAPTVKNTTSPIRKLEHMLVLKGIPCYVPIGDTVPIRGDVSANKVVFSSFHQSKGLERKCIILYGADASYFKFFARDENPSECTETWYVGATRSMCHLFIVHHCGENMLPFLKITPSEFGSGKYSKHIRFIGKQYYHTKAVLEHSTIRNTTVTNMVQYISVQAATQLADLCVQVFEQVTPVGRAISLSGSVSGLATNSEMVADVNGIVLTARFEATRGSMSTIHKEVLRPGFGGDDEFFRRAFTNVTVKRADLAIDELMYIGLLYAAVSDDLYFRLAQISRYNWIDEIAADAVCQNMVDNLPSAASLTFERNIGYNINPVAEGLTADFYAGVNRFIADHFGLKFGKLYISGRMDACDGDTIWEFKCTEELTLEHKLQLVVYAFLWQHIMEPVHGPREFRLFNIRTEEMWVLNTEPENREWLDQIMVVLVRNKYPNSIHRTDDEFVTDSLNYRATLSIVGSQTNLKCNLETCFASQTKPLYMILDTETTGLSCEKDHIVQLSYVICDHAFNHNSQFDSFITLPSNVVMPPESTAVHGITGDQCRYYGRPFSESMVPFMRDLQQVTHVVGHNIKFDLDMMYAALKMYQHEDVAVELMKKMTICTMRDPLSTAIAGAINSLGRPKAPRQDELYYAVINEPMPHAHNSLHDVLNLRRIVSKMHECYTNGQYDYIKLSHLPPPIPLSPQSNTIDIVPVPIPVPLLLSHSKPAPVLEYTTCICGGKYKTVNKAKHILTIKHVQMERQQQCMARFTYNTQTTH